jgi:hypothetical protein
MAFNPSAKIRMQTEALHLLSRKPSGRFRFSHAERAELPVDVGTYYIKSPTAIAFLHLNARNPDRWEWTDLLFRLPASRQLR